MGRSSRIFCLICVVAAAPAFAQSRGIAHAPAMFGFRPIMPARQPVVPPGFRLDPQRHLAMTPIPRRLERLGRIQGRNGFGIDGVGLGLSLATQTRVYGADGSDLELQVIPALAPPTCVRPQIIKVGLGVRHPSRTRVIYGPPTGCQL